MAEDIEETKDKDIKEELRENRYPPIEVAEARIKLALLRHRAMVARVTPTSEKRKVRL